MKKNKLLFSVTKKDLQVKFFRASGPGGQHRNKTDSACKITHPASGATGMSQKMKQQHQNKKIAFRRMTESVKFKLWVSAQVAAITQGYRDVEHQVDEMMNEKNLKIEYIGEKK
jgi:protein subunit release factor B